MFAIVSQHCSLVDVCQYLVQAAQSGNDCGAFAMAALAQQSHPKLATRSARRLIALVKKGLESANEAQQTAAAEVLTRMGKRAAYVDVIAKEVFPTSMQKAMLTIKNADVFESLIASARQCQIAVGLEIVRAAEQIALAVAEGHENGVGYERARRIVALAKDSLGRPVHT
jgi:hypothetical protein